MSNNNPEEQEKLARTGFTPEEYAKMSINELVKRTVYVRYSENPDIGKIIGKSSGPELSSDQDYEPK